MTNKNKYETDANIQIVVNNYTNNIPELQENQPLQTNVIAISSIAKMKEFKGYEGDILNSYCNTLKNQKKIDAVRYKVAENVPTIQLTEIEKTRGKQACSSLALGGINSKPMTIDDPKLNNTKTNVINMQFASDANTRQRGY